MPNKPRRPWLAAILTFATLGLGHIYAGAGKKGIIFFLIWFLFAVVSIPFWHPHSIKITFSISVIAGIAFFIYCLVDAVKLARENSLSYELKKYNKWYLYLLIYVISSFIISPLITATVKHKVVQAYRIPSGAMMPTLLPGDYVLADKSIYPSSSPRRGDIVIFPFPQKPVLSYIKRVIGVGGDVIEIKDKQVYINNSKYNENYIIHSDPNTISGTAGPRDNFGPVTVPDNALFVLGDNRDNSYDSRFWGFVAANRVKGKVVTRYWSWDQKTGKVRWDRIGTQIQ